MLLYIPFLTDQLNKQLRIYQLRVVHMLFMLFQQQHLFASMSDWLTVSSSYSLTGKSNKLFLFSLRNAVGTATMA